MVRIIVEVFLAYSSCNFWTHDTFLPYTSDIELKEQLLLYRTTPKKTYMDALLATSFMRKHSNPDTKLGHKNESIIMRNALKENMCSNSVTRCRIDFACEVGLVANLQQDYLHASPDYLLLVSENDERHVAFAEIKCRTRVHTANLDHELSIGSDKWVEVHAGSQSFKTYVRNIKERFQLIHQAATLQMNHGLLVIGDKDGNVIRGIWIHFGEDLI